MAYRAEYNPESARNVMHAIFFCSQRARQSHRDSLWLSLALSLSGFAYKALWLKRPLFGSKGPCWAWNVVPEFHHFLLVCMAIKETPTVLSSCWIQSHLSIKVSGLVIFSDVHIISKVSPGHWLSGRATIIRGGSTIPNRRQPKEPGYGDLKIWLEFLPSSMCAVPGCWLSGRAEARAG